MSVVKSSFTRTALAAALAVSTASGAMVLASSSAHAASSVGGSIATSEVMARANDWLARDIPYNQGSYATDVTGTKSYRQDCSGFVSMAWHLSNSENTDSLDNRALTTRVALSDLKPGDALDNDPGDGSVKASGHIILFDHWVNKAAGQFAYIDEVNSTLNVRAGVTYLTGDSSGKIAGHPANEYFGLRYNKLVADTQNPAPVSTPGAITATVTSDNTAHVGIVGSDGSLWSTDAAYGGSGWSGNWGKLDGSALKALTSVTVNNVVHVYALGSTGKVYTKDADYNTGYWTTGWAEVPGGASGAQALTASATGNTVHLQTIGSDGALYTTDANYGGTGWSGNWTKLDGSGLKALSSVTVGNVVHVYALGSTGKVYTKDADYNTGQWTTGWAEVPGGASGATALTASATGNTVHLQTIGSDGALYTTDAAYGGAGWSGVWTRLDGSGLKALASTVTGNVLHVYAIGSTGKVFTKDADYNTGQWSTGWTEVPGGAQS
ncbi:hypothetical protein ACFZCK_25985 [Kitasatospora purpeofusca]|uniref:hypothetical protein n=1 Tax=Kitasatospora purpeofusca TaxID=67352 RepID=UPI0036EE0E49